MTVKEFAQKYTDPRVIGAFREAVEAGKDAPFVMGAFTYDLIRNDSDARKAYEDLIGKGLRIGFNPKVPPETEAFANDKGDACVISRISGTLTKYRQPLPFPSATKLAISDLYAESVRISDFGKSAEELAAMFNYGHGIVRH